MADELGGQIKSFESLLKAWATPGFLEVNIYSFLSWIYLSWETMFLYLDRNTGLDKVVRWPAVIHLADFLSSQYQCHPRVVQGAIQLCSNVTTKVAKTNLNTSDCPKDASSWFCYSSYPITLVKGLNCSYEN